MKQKINGWWTWMLGGLLGLLGFSACDPFGVMRCEYGMPYSDYKVIGEVKDEAGKPVEGIRVVFAPWGRDSESAPWVNDTLYTDRAGKVAGELEVDGIGDHMEVEFADVDGPENGSFEPLLLKRSDLKITQTKEGDKSWYQGEYTIEAKARLKKKAE
jgi:putative lipoprotein (rSAM/lipoprotein system)